MGLTELDEAEYEEFLKIMVEENPSSALAKHLCGRHEAIKEINNNNNNSLVLSPEKLQKIIDCQKSSELLSVLKNFKIGHIQNCCVETFSRLSMDASTICLKSTEFYSVWLAERENRITASRAYSLFTYFSNKNPDWKKKSNDYFYGSSFSNDDTKYGLEQETYAREIYENLMSMEVVQCGLVISELNPWLGCSPDGIVFENNKPFKLIEIKCPKEGKRKGIEDTVKSIKWLTEEHGEVTLKSKHMYYAQIQISMAILNLSSTDFIIYSSFDKNIKIIPVSFNEKFTKHLLITLKKVYFKKMIHNICIKQKEESEKQKNNKNTVIVTYKFYF
ncbi:uncharacterized protein LOC141533037 [Cotesia typhae]|uniref:uncharacterized protein LOC141533037 n=1 Tax=Cotesia typhae TaxID=2053667 RepID=UPI003D68AA36